MVVDVMVKFEPCEYTRKMIFRSVTQACQSLIKKSSSSKWYIFTLIFTSSFLFSRLKKASGPQRIYLVVYTLLDVIVVVVVTMDLKFGWTVRWRAATGNKSCSIWGAYISPVQPTSSARRDGEKAECGGVSRTWVFLFVFSPSKHLYFDRIPL